MDGWVIDHGTGMPALRRLQPIVWHFIRVWSL